MKKAGILLPVASLNGTHAVGDFGKTAYKFVDIIKNSGFDMWQILPLNPLGYGNSPYQPYSSYAGDEIYISLDMLFEEKLLDKKVPALSQTQKINYNFVRKFKAKYLKAAFENFNKKNMSKDASYKEFLKFDFVFDYAVYITFKKMNGLKSWNLWRSDMKSWIMDKKLNIKKYEKDIEYEIFVQYVFYTQWMKLKNYANKNGIKIVGDIPFYVGLDSLDVWQNRQYFQLTKFDNPKFIAGVPPDSFSNTGQRWGNPIYDWDKIKQDDFSFWIKRLSYNSKLYDIIRLDHFRAFDTYWRIDAKNKTALKGKWLLAPGYELFDKIKSEMNDTEFIAEDLGEIRKEVLKLRDHYNLKGMVIIQYDLNPRKRKHYIKCSENSVCYTGTHDNQTLMGWFGELNEKKQRDILRLFARLGINNGEIHDDFFEFAMRCKSEYVIIPVQDILGLGDEARINTPSTLNDTNWSYKLTSLKPLMEKQDFLKKIISQNRIE